MGDQLRRLGARLAPLLGGKAAAGVISLAYLAIAARDLGPRDYGVLVLLHAYVLAVDAALNLQAWQVMVRYGGERGADAHRLLGPLAKLELAGGALAALAAAAFAPLAGKALGWPSEVILLAGPYSLAALANARSIAGGYLQALGRFDLLGLHHAVSPLVRLLGAAAAAVMGWGLTGFLIAWVAAALAEWLSMWIAALVVMRRREGLAGLGGSLRALIKARPGIRRYMLACKADAAYTQFAPQIVPLCVGAVLGPAAAGIYAVAARACQIIAQPTLLIAQAAFSEFASAGGRGAMLRTARPILMLAFGAGLLLAAPLIMAPGAITAALGGAAFASAGGLLVWLTAARLLAVGGPILGAALAADGRAGASVSVNLGVTALCLPALPFMLTAWGPLGAGPYALAHAVLSVGLLALLALRSAPSATAVAPGRA